SVWRQSDVILGGSPSGPDVLADHAGRPGACLQHGRDAGARALGLDSVPRLLPLRPEPDRRRPRRTSLRILALHDGARAGTSAPGLAVHSTPHAPCPAPCPDPPASQSAADWSWARHLGSGPAAALGGAAGLGSAGG